MNPKRIFGICVLFVALLIAGAAFVLAVMPRQFSLCVLPRKRCELPLILQGCLKNL